MSGQRLMKKQGQTLENTDPVVEAPAPVESKNESLSVVGDMTENVVDKTAVENVGSAAMNDSFRCRVCAETIVGQKVFFHHLQNHYEPSKLSSDCEKHIFIFSLGLF